MSLRVSAPLIVCMLMPFLLATMAQAQAAKTPVSTFKVIHTYPHDPQAYTQGLVYHNGFLYEGTGLYGRSSLRKVKLETGEVLQRIDLDPKYFGEGIALYKNEIVQLTWKSQTGFVYDLNDFHLL